MSQHDDPEARLAAIVTSSDDAIISKDLNGIITSWNRAAEQMFGFTAEEAIGQSIFLIIPDDRRDEEAFVIGRVRAGLSVDHYETVRRRKDGSLIDISLTVSPIRINGVVVGASKIARDVTEQRRLQDQADQASRLKDEFLAVLSHELRTPLNTVLGYARMLRRDEPRMTGEVRERALDALERNAEVLARLVNDVLDTSRIVTGKLRLTMEACAIDKVVEAALETVRPAADAKGAAIRVQMDRGLRVVADRDRLQQVVEPAVERDQVSRRPRTVSVSTPERHGVEIVVADTGIGSRGWICPTCSSGSGRRTPARRGNTAASASAWRSRATPSSCTADRLPSRVKAPARARLHRDAARRRRARAAPARDQIVTSARARRTASPGTRNHVTPSTTMS